MNQGVSDGMAIKTTEVAILGGGLAGLSTARALRQAGIPFLLLEARDRLGGRILTVDETGQPGADGFDLGPSWFWPAGQPELAQLVTELGLLWFAQQTKGDLLFEPSASETPRRTGNMGPSQGSMRLAGGTGALVNALARHLPGDCLRLNAPVTELRLSGDGVILTVAGHGQPVEFLEARQVISTLPPRLMAETIRLFPAMAPATVDRWRGTPTWMAPHAKILVIYDSPFWREAGLSGMAQSLVGPLAEVHDASTTSGGAALFGFIGIPAAKRTTLSQDDLIRAAVGQLTRLFGPKAAKPRATLLKDWATDRFTATLTDQASSGHPTAANAPWITGAWADRLDLAGSETSNTEPGYLAGAVESARRAAQAWIRRRLV